MFHFIYVVVFLMSSSLLSMQHLAEYREFVLHPRPLPSQKQSYFKTLEPLDDSFFNLLTRLIPENIHTSFTEESSDENQSSQVAFFQGSPATAKTLVARALAQQTNSECHVISAEHAFNYIRQDWLRDKNLSSHKTPLNKALETLLTQNAEQNHVIIIENADLMGKNAARDLIHYVQNNPHNTVKFILTSKKPSYYLPAQIANVLLPQNKFLFRSLNESERRVTLDHFVSKVSLPLARTFNPEKFRTISKKINGYSFEDVEILTHEVTDYAYENYENPTITPEHFDRAIKARRTRIRRAFLSRLYKSVHLIGLSFLSLAELAFSFRSVLTFYRKFF